MMNPQVIGLLIGIGVVFIVILSLKCYFSYLDTNNTYGTIQGQNSISLL